MEISNLEAKEIESRKRNVILYFVRHGEAKYSTDEDMSGYLTEKGREQAREAARDLYEELPQGAVVEFISSDLKRADQTTVEMKEEVKKLNTDPQISKNISVHYGKPIVKNGAGENNGGGIPADFDLYNILEPEDNRFNGESDRVKTFKQLAISDKHTEEFWKLSTDEQGNPRNAVAFWLINPDQNVEEMEGQFRNVLRYFNAFSRIVSPGPDTYIVAIIHGGATDVAIGRLLGESSLGQLKNCEAFKISFLTNGQTTLSLRGETKDISI